jgi:hypothetical protein
MALVCRCCRREGALNERRLCPECAVCLHCERRPSVSARGLCRRCHGCRDIRALYRRSHQWTPAWELHLRRKTAEVQAALRRPENLDGLLALLRDAAGPPDQSSANSP